MDRKKRMRLIFGLMLILVGAWFLAVAISPTLGRFIFIDFSWPWWVIGAGLFLLLIGLLTGAAGMAVPAMIVAGIGVLLYWQNATGNWASWAYAWTLIPGFVGLGLLITGLLAGNSHSARHAGRLILISVVGFLFFGSLFGDLRVLGPYWPVLLIILGLWLLFRAFLRPRA